MTTSRNFRYCQGAVAQSAGCLSQAASRAIEVQFDVDHLDDYIDRYTLSCADVAPSTRVVNEW